jgi:ABC-type polar amino acid transport system ATPase subunit
VSPLLEVTSALDPTLVGEVLDLLSDLAIQGTTMLIATHEMQFARDVAHRVALLDAGRLVEVAPAQQFFDSPSQPETIDFLSRVPKTQ